MGIRWEKFEFADSGRLLKNPGCGFYRMKKYMLTDSEADVERFFKSYPIREGTTLEMLEINISRYFRTELTDKAKENLRTILTAYKKAGVTLIIRILYDWDGKGKLYEPKELDEVIWHMSQIKSVLAEFPGTVYIMQGVFIGSWGEMHNSAYLDNKSINILVKKAVGMLPPGAYSAVRTPAIWRLAAGRTEPLDKQEASDGSEMSRVSLFNDAITASETDFGSYGEMSRRDPLSIHAKWRREEELRFQNRLCLYVPNGGEVLVSNPLNDFEQANRTLRRMRVSYLNSDYDRSVLDKWESHVYNKKGSAFDGRSGLDYIASRLGYRFLITGAEFRGGMLGIQETLEVKMNNLGYSPIYIECGAELRFHDDITGRNESIEFDAELRYRTPLKPFTLEIRMPGLEDGIYTLSLRLYGRQGDWSSTIHTANKNAGEDGFVPLGRLHYIKSLTLEELI